VALQEIVFTIRRVTVSVLKSSKLRSNQPNTVRRLGKIAQALCTCGLLGMGTSAHAAAYDVVVTIQNLVPSNGISFAPMRVGFGNGSFDSFNVGQTAGAAIVSIAEGGSGSAWFPAFAAADSSAVTGTVGGLLQSGQSASASFRVDSAVNAYFTFAAMAVPSNDYFIGNDSPTAHRLFDANGNLLLSTLGIRARDIWDAGSETTDPLASAFLVGGTNNLRTAQNGLVESDFLGLTAFNGLTTAAGYVLNSSLSADTDIYRISFAATAVPLPASGALLAFGMLPLAWLARRRQQRDLSQ
jgi:hypothetical protein